MKYSFRQLEVFLAVAHYQNISKAADTLAMSQSATSSALSDFEKQFNVQFFDRIGKKLQLNELGRALRPQARALLDHALDFQQRLVQQRSAPVLNVGATLTIGNYLLVGVMARYMAEQPGAKIHLHVANTAIITDKVRNFELDVGLIEGEHHHPELLVIPWLEDELVVFCSPQHPFAALKTLHDEHLLAATWILRERGSGTRQTFDRAMHGLLAEMELGLELEHTEAIKRAVAANLGIGCLSRVTVEDEFQRGSLVPLAVPHRNFSRRFYFITHRDKYLSSGITHWLDLCRQLERKTE